jgi:hypothetical protein
MTLLHPAPRVWAATALAVAVAAAVLPTPARSQDYPRLGLYGQVRGNGYPLWDSSGNLDPVSLDQIGRYDEVILDASPITEYRPDAIAALRQRNPAIHLLAYVMAGFVWPSIAIDSTVHYPTRYWRMIRNMDGFLYNKRGAQYGLTTNAFANVNLAKRDGSGTYVVAESLAVLWNDAIVSHHLWDGLFVDTYCTTILWSQTAAESIDYVRAGYPTLAAFDAGWGAGTDTLASRLRQFGGPASILVGNCGQGTKYAWFNGWMREDFPHQNGGTWDENMYRSPGGYFTDDRRFLAPQHDYLFSAAGDPSQPYSADNLRRARFGLGSAALGLGYGVFGYAGRMVDVYPYFQWWYDEYAVDRASGRASTLRRDAGWLGQPLAPYSQVIWVSSAPDAISNNGFETDLSGWMFISTYPGSFTRDPTTAAVGTASAKATITHVEAVPWAAGVATTTTLFMSPGQYYSATFWAKASPPRTVTVVAGAPGGGELAHGQVDMTTSWKHFQVVFYPTASGASPLQFHLGGDVGDVWLDDLHLQPGTSSIYRRDFQHGIVLVNPTNLDLVVPLERSFNKIRGLADPATNDGSVARQFAVPANDALFLLGTDQVRPAAVLDLHRIR